MSDFTKRLRRAMKSGDMGIGDIHHWFGRPRSTVRTWVLDARTPQGPAGERAHLLLRHLEAKIAARSGFPIPQTVSAHERPDYVKRLRHGNGARVPSRNPA